MELFICIVLALSVQAPAIEGSPVLLQSPRLIELHVGGVLRLNCSSSSTYLIEFIEIGQPLTIEEEIFYNIEQEGNPRVHYSQEGCQHNDPPDINCIKTLEMDVVESLHGKSFQCRARTRHPSPDSYYSEGSYLHVRQHITLTPTHVLTEIPSSLERSGMSTKTTTITTTATVETSPIVLPTPTSDVLCQCSGSVATKYSFFLSLATAAVVVIVCYIL